MHRVLAAVAVFAAASACAPSALALDEPADSYPKRSSIAHSLDYALHSTKPPTNHPAYSGPRTKRFVSAIRRRIAGNHSQIHRPIRKALSRAARTAQRLSEGEGLRINPTQLRILQFQLRIALGEHAGTLARDFARALATERKEAYEKAALKASITPGPWSVVRRVATTIRDQVVEIGKATWRNTVAPIPLPPTRTARGAAGILSGS